MPVKYVTPSRAGFIVTTAVVVMLFNVLFVLPSYDDSCEQYHVRQVLKGPSAQDDPALVRWVRRQMVPPSRLPYNLSHFMNGLNHEDPAPNSLYSPSQEFILGHVEEIFGDRIAQSRVFLEAGAYDGEFLSNTLFLEHEYNWRGLLVEANPTFFSQLLLKRRKSWALNVCLNIKPYPSQEKFLMGSETPESDHLYKTEGDQGGSPNLLLEQHISLGSSGLEEFRDNTKQYAQEGEIEVQCVPLYTVVQAMGRNHIDFLSLDVEHAEMGILNTIPWDKLTFTVLAIEHLTKDDLVAYMDERGYHHVASKIADHIFINKNNTIIS